MSILRNYRSMSTPSLALTGAQVSSLMRCHHVTIADLSDRTGITMTRIREVRVAGLRDHLAAVDWVQAITRVKPEGVDFQSRASCLAWLNSQT